MVSDNQRHDSCSGGAHLSSTEDQLLDGLDIPAFHISPPRTQGTCSRALARLLRGDDGPTGSRPLEGVLSLEDPRPLAELPGGAYEGRLQAGRHPEIPIRAFLPPRSDLRAPFWARIEDLRPALRNEVRIAAFALAASAAELAGGIVHSLANRLQAALNLVQSLEDPLPGDPQPTPGEVLAVLETCCELSRSVGALLAKAHARPGELVLTDALQDALGLLRLQKERPTKILYQEEGRSPGSLELTVPTSFPVGLAALLRDLEREVTLAGNGGGITVRAHGADQETTVSILPSGAGESLARLLAVPGGAAAVLLESIALRSGGRLRIGPGDGVPPGVHLSLGHRSPEAGTQRPSERRRLPRILVVDPDQEFVRLASEGLSRQGPLESLGAGSLEDALAVLRAAPVELLICSTGFGRDECERFLRLAREVHPGIDALVLWWDEEARDAGLDGLVASADRILFRSISRPS